jgi:hypothetical protein
MADELGTDPGRDFAALMSGAAQAAEPAAEPAPFGWTVDAQTGERRPKKTAGRPRKSPGLDDLKAAAAAKSAEQAEAGAVAEPAGDRAPVTARRKRRGPAKPGVPDSGGATPQHRPGQISKGVNKLYRRAGKIVTAMDADIGAAIIAATRNTAEDDEPDDSVGGAWEEVCRTNPRIRRFVLKLIAGGAWGQLVMAHLPILLAILMKDAISRHIPFMKLLTALAEPDEDGKEAGGLAGLMAGMTPEDMQQVMAMAKGMFPAAAQPGKAAA